MKSEESGAGTLVRSTTRGMEEPHRNAVLGVELRRHGKWSCRANA